ncbi:hypothetical protein BpHYR1_050820 [Brachionus plicatilis]|uniref:Uncharacterized protein n=1 Tax=Brachionus plicatilis TaxID=10195 RepID=A0A3M7T7J4_BRAPC|nr:hypothetical protein BpHYR1_050820 [Brachionus plicatilis]
MPNDFSVEDANDFFKSSICKRFQNGLLEFVSIFVYPEIRSKIVELSKILQTLLTFKIAFKLKRTLMTYSLTKWFVSKSYKQKIKGSKSAESRSELKNKLLNFDLYIPIIHKHRDITRKKFSHKDAKAKECNSN